MIEQVQNSTPDASTQNNQNFADVASNPQLIAQAQPGPSAVDVGLCRADKALQGGAGVAQVAGGTVMGMGGAVTTILGGAVALLETPFMGVEGKQPFWGAAVASAGMSGIGTGISISSDGINRVGAQFSAPACNGTR